ncbi:MAG: hypothetical protein R3C10_26455 [Pirellulales bacterium]
MDDSELADERLVRLNANRLRRQGSRASGDVCESDIGGKLREMMMAITVRDGTTVYRVATPVRSTLAAACRHSAAYSIGRTTGSGEQRVARGKKEAASA